MLHTVLLIDRFPSVAFFQHNNTPYVYVFWISTWDKYLGTQRGAKLPRLYVFAFRKPLPITSKTYFKSLFLDLTLESQQIFHSYFGAVKAPLTTP